MKLTKWLKQPTTRWKGMLWGMFFGAFVVLMIYIVGAFVVFIVKATNTDHYELTFQDYQATCEQQVPGTVEVVQITPDDPYAWKCITEDGAEHGLDLTLYCQGFYNDPMARAVQQPPGYWDFVPDNWYCAVGPLVS